MALSLFDPTNIGMVVHVIDLQPYGDGTPGVRSKMSGGHGGDYGPYRDTMDSFLQSMKEDDAKPA